MGQQLLIEELTPNECGLIQESTTDGKNIWLSGIFMQGEVKNRNGRTYPVNEISTAVNSGKQRIIESNGIFGELDHPPTLTINLDRISHIITELSLNGANGIGKIKLIETPMGSIAKELVNSGVKIGVSTRGAGSLDDSGIVSGYNFITIDLVAQPSAPNAYPTTIYESLKQYKNGHNIFSLAEQVREDKLAQVYLKKEILKFLNQNLFSKK
jgi:hypothetical protein